MGILKAYGSLKPKGVFGKGSLRNPCELVRIYFLIVPVCLCVCVCVCVRARACFP